MFRRQDAQEARFRLELKSSLCINHTTIYPDFAPNRRKNRLDDDLKGGALLRKGPKISTALPNQQGLLEYAHRCHSCRQQSS